MDPASLVRFYADRLGVTPERIVIVSDMEDAGRFYPPATIVINRSVFNRLSPEHQKELAAHEAAHLAAYQKSGNMGHSGSWRENMKNLGFPSPFPALKFSEFADLRHPSAKGARMEKLKLFIIGTREFEEEMKKRIETCASKETDPEKIYESCFSFDVPQEMRESIITEISHYLRRRGS